MTQEAIAARATNSSGVSVGTSLALETIIPNWPVFDPEREAPPKVPLSKYSRVWINLRTIARNLHNAVANEYKETLKPNDLGAAIAEEAWAVAQAIEQASSSAVKAMIYWPKYNELQRYFPVASLRTPSTEKQKSVEKIVSAAMEFAHEVLATNHPQNYKRVSIKIDPGSYAQTLMMTHMPVDLLNVRRFGSLELLESHTGVVKARNLWYTKLFAGKSLSVIPFCEMSLQVFGDDHSFHPKNISVKREIITIAESNHWSWMTTESKMRADILKHPENAFKIEMLKLLHPL